MPTPAKIIERWTYLRGLLLEQLADLQGGSLTVHTAGENVSGSSETRPRSEIEKFDELSAEGGEASSSRTEVDHSSLVG